jgi:hypothetical protein
MGKVVTRRSFLHRSAGAAGGAVIVGTPAVLAESAAARQAASGARVVKSPSRGVPHEPVMAFVRDADRGEVTVVAGTRETTYRDRDLVRRLLEASPGQNRS